MQTFYVVVVNGKAMEADTNRGVADRLHFRYKPNGSIVAVQADSIDEAKTQAERQSSGSTLTPEVSEPVIDESPGELEGVDLLTE